VGAANAILRANAQTALDEASDQLVTAYGGRSGGDKVVDTPIGHVVVVQIEAALRDFIDSRKLMEFCQRVVADQVCPQHSVRRPHRRVDEYGHYSIVTTRSPCSQATHQILLTVGARGFARLHNLPRLNHSVLLPIGKR